MEESIAKKRSDALVDAMVGKELSTRWWQSPNRAFDMKSPVDMWEEDYEQVYNYLMHHACGGI